MKESIDWKERCIQYDLYAGIPPHEKSSKTSLDAALSMVDHLGKIQQEVYEFIKSMGDFGATADECEVALKLRGNTLQPRKRELELKGLIVKVYGKMRMTRSRRWAQVYKAK